MDLGRRAGPIPPVAGGSTPTSTSCTAGSAPRTCSCSARGTDRARSTHAAPRRRRSRRARRCGCSATASVRDRAHGSEPTPLATDAVRGRRRGDPILLTPGITWVELAEGEFSGRPGQPEGRANPAAGWLIVAAAVSIRRRRVQVPFERRSDSRSPGPLASDAAASCAPTALANSVRSTSRNTPNGVGEWSSLLSRASANASDGYG